MEIFGEVDELALVELVVVVGVVLFELGFHHLFEGGLGHLLCHRVKYCF